VAGVLAELFQRAGILAGMLTEVATAVATSEITFSALPAAMWVSIALLAAGYARTRNRSAWAWFISSLFLGPLAVFCLVVWPSIPQQHATPGGVEANVRSTSP